MQERLMERTVTITLEGRIDYGSGFIVCSGIGQSFVHVEGKFRHYKSMKEISDHGPQKCQVSDSRDSAFTTFVHGIFGPRYFRM